MDTFSGRNNMMDAVETCEDSDELDPRIKVELESLNQAASDVNRLEKEINEARHKYQETFSESSQELEQLKQKHGSKVKKARPYYEVKERAKEAQSEALLSARKFQSANGIYLAAKETISLAELRLEDDKAASLSQAWQEMLNHALVRVMESEQEKTKSEKEHLHRAAVYGEMEKKLHILEKKHKKSIAKAKPYFDAKHELELKLQQIKQSIEDLQLAMHSAKRQYAMSLKSLETISDCIHEARRQKLILMYPREPGVGAEEETDSQLAELPSLSSHDVSDQVSSDSEEEDQDDYDTDETAYSKLGDDTTKHNYYQKKALDSSFDNVEETKNSKNAHRLIGVKERPQLRKSASLPSYVVEETYKHEKNVLEIETDNVLLKMESGSVTVEESTSGKRRNNESENKLKHSLQILDPSALCLREATMGGNSY